MKIEYFDDVEQSQVAIGTVERLKKQLFNITVLPTGWGKTSISLGVAGRMAQEQSNKTLNLIIMATKAKREDKEFEEAVKLAEKKFNVTLNLVPIKGNKVVTTAGMAHAMKQNTWRSKVLNATRKAPTLFILDEVHMAFRNSTTVTAKALKKLVSDISKKQKVSIVGLTATPFDTTILDVVGYQVLAGQYNSRNDWYTKNVVGFKSGYSQQSGGRTTMQEIKQDIVDPTDYHIKLDGFSRFDELLNEIKDIIYVPTVEQNFHLPTNVYDYIRINLTKTGEDKYKDVLKASELEYYETQTKARVDKTLAMTADENVVAKVVDLATQENVKQPLIFYFYDTQRTAMTKELNRRGIAFKELNGNSHSFFSVDITDDMPVLVNYKSGAVSFESKVSNTSIYLALPDSSVEFEQSLGRNTRRGQTIDEITNYIIVPCLSGQDIEHFENGQRRINEKIKRNQQFIQLLKDIEHSESKEKENVLRK